MKYTKITMSVLLALSLQTQSQAADLLDIYHAAQSQDAVFGAARAAREAGQEKLSQGRALLMPSVTLTADKTRYDTTVEAASLPAPVDNKYTSHGYGVSLVQPLFREQNWALYVESDLQVIQSEAQYRLAEQDLVLRSAQAYFDV